MAEGNHGLNKINIQINAPSEEGTSSPRFGNPKVYEALEKVGKHGKSHHEYMKVMAMHKAETEMRKIHAL